MTEATQSRPRLEAEQAPVMHYRVGMSQPQSHLFEVKLSVRVDQQLRKLASGVLDLKMPVWTPGSYLVREYARHLQEFKAYDRTGKPRTWQKVSKNHWQVDLKNSDELFIEYRIFANELTVRTNHLDQTHGYFNSAALLLYIPGWEKHPIWVTIEPPKDWKVTTSLPEVPEQVNTFKAVDIDTLIDSPFEIGTHNIYEFTVREKPHKLAIWGEGNGNSERLIKDFEKIIEEEAELFGGLPYEQYLFLLHLSSQGFGGLEHKDSCSLNYPRFGLRNAEKYNRFMQLVAHEFFHLWNVKRIRPKALEVFNYDEENYTQSLWFCEGTTSYYDLVIPWRAGIFDLKTFFNELSKDITRLQTIPGRKIQPLSESSWDAWIKLYRRDSNSDNCQISYYLKGEVVSFLLDLLIRERTRNRRSLDDVMRGMWEEFGREEIGYTPEQLKQVIESVAETDLTDFFERYIHGTDELPFNEYLEPFGLRLKAEKPDNTPYLGLQVVSDGSRELIKFVEAGSPAQMAGIDPDDELLALNGFRVNAQQLSDRLKDYQPGDTVELSIFHQDQLQSCSVTLAEPRPSSYKITSVKDPSPQSQRNFSGWLGCPYHKL
ncbi:M61 family metallopeptidase [Capilliphycus salinus ALCB114379]|uniref:M61 family metallopeptidase n=1 Tax=Capilliphycus salinus TaxID=2768948 RepID=UPI0039A74933